VTKLYQYDDDDKTAKNERRQSVFWASIAAMLVDEYITHHSTMVGPDKLVILMEIESLFDNINL